MRRLLGNDLPTGGFRRLACDVVLAYNRLCYSRGTRVPYLTLVYQQVAKRVRLHQ